MACLRQIYTIFLFIAISIYVMTSQVTDDVFNKLKSSRACFGIAGINCTSNFLACGNEENILINDVAYLGTETTVCAGVGTCETLDNYIICCTDETDVTVHNDAIDRHRFEIYKTCSGKQKSCKVNVADIGVKTGRVTSVTVKYHCIKNKSVINYRENITMTKKIVHIMYNGQQDDFVNRICYCSIAADSGIDLYSVDIRLQKHDSAISQCTNTTLKWGHNQFEDVEQCVRSGDNSTLRKMNQSKNINDMWVQLSIQDDIPTMVWIAAKATSGKVNVKCGQINVNNQGTTSTLSTTSHTTTINARTHIVSSAIASKSVFGSKTVTVSGMPTTAATTVHLHESSTNTTVVATGSHSRNTAPEDETNIGAIVGPVVGTILIVVLVVIGVIVKRRRACEICSKKKGDTDDQSYQNVPPTIQLSGISNVAHAYENTPGTVQNYEKLQPSMDTNEYQFIGKTDHQQLDQDNAAYVNQGENNTQSVLEMSGGDGDRNNEEQNYYSSIQDDNKVSHREDDGEYYNTKDRCVNDIRNLEDMS